MELIKPDKFFSIRKDDYTYYYGVNYGTSELNINFLFGDNHNKIIKIYGYDLANLFETEIEERMKYFGNCKS